MSIYTYPARYLRWFVENNELALVTTNVVDTSVVVNSIFSRIDESKVDGMLVEYEGGVPHLDIASKNIHKQEPNINRRIHGALIDYVLSKLYASKPSMNEADIISANRHYTTFRRRIAITDGGKVGYAGPKVPIPDRRMALR